MVLVRKFTSSNLFCSLNKKQVSFLVRVITEGQKGYKSHYCYSVLPKRLSFDEFKYTKGHPAFEYINAET